MYRERVCLLCNKTFIPNSPNQKFCHNDHYSECCVCYKTYKITKPSQVGNIASGILMPCSLKCAKISKDLRMKETNIYKYGHECSIYGEEQLKKRINTYNSKYGTTHPMKSDIIKHKVKDTVKTKYNVDNVFQLEEIKLKSKKTKSKLYGNNFQKLYSRISLSNLKHNHNETNKFENILSNIISSIISDKMIYNSRNIIKNPNTNYGLELDIYIPDLSIAFEVNGNYWHSKQNQINIDNIKLEECNKIGIKLYQIWEDEFKDLNKLKIKIKEILKGVSNEEL